MPPLKPPNKSRQHFGLFILPIILLNACSSSQVTPLASIQDNDGLIAMSSTGKPFSGIARSTYTNGQYRIECVVRRGQLIEWKRWYPNGVMEYHAKDPCAPLKATSLSFDSLLRREESNLSGDFVARHPNNRIAVTLSLANGVPKGIAKAWRPDGNLQSEIDFSSGNPITVKRYNKEGQAMTELVMRVGNASDLAAQPIPAPGTNLASRMAEFRLFHDNGNVHIHGSFSEDGKSFRRIRTWDSDGKRIWKPVPGKKRVAFRLKDHTLEMKWVEPGSLKRSLLPKSGQRGTLTLHHGIWLGTHEVTKEQWESIMDKKPWGPGAHGRLPATNLSWHEAVEFCQRLTRIQSDLGTLPFGYHFDLPTPSQWEYACRAGDAGLLPAQVNAMVWHKANTEGWAKLVASLEPNAWGFYDMLGNVYEWGHEEHHLRLFNAVPQTIPYWEIPITLKYFMGGSVTSSPKRCLYSRINTRHPDSRYQDLGFRVALVPTFSPNLFPDESDD